MQKPSILDMSLRRLLMTEMGKAGGQSRSAAKLAAARKNVRKAIAARKRKLALAA